MHAEVWDLEMASSHSSNVSLSNRVKQLARNVVFARPIPGPKKGLRLDIYGSDICNDTRGRPAVLLVHGGLSMFDHLTVG